MEKYTFGGCLSSGEAFYYRGKEVLAVEKDHQYLTDPTPEQKEEIYKRFPHSKPQT